MQIAQLRGSSLSTLFGTTSFGGSAGEPSDLVAFTSAAVAMPLYQHAGLMSGLTQWDGSMTPGSQRTAPAAAPAPDPAPAAPASPFTFNPFDRASWWTNPKGSTVDTAV